MKEQARNIEVQVNEEEIGKLPEKEFRIMIAKIFQNLKNRMEKIQEVINTIKTIAKDIEEIKIKQTVMNNSIIEIKNTLEGIADYLKQKNESVSWKIKWWK